jgi:hypothetical protein
MMFGPEQTNVRFTGDALTPKTVSKHTWPLVEIVALMSGNWTVGGTSPLSKCPTVPPSIWR